MSNRLSRAEPSLPPPAPVRIVHLGLGNFFRAHPAWYTHHASDAARWGIAAFTGRKPQEAHKLAPQGGRYTLITTAAEQDRFEVINSVVAVHPSDDQQALLGYCAAPQTAIITLTITEFGYPIAPGGGLDQARIKADLERLRTPLNLPLDNAVSRLVAGLAARQAARAGGLSVLPCDNLGSNGAALRRIVLELAAAVSPTLADWIAQEIEFASCMVDRITPATTAADIAAVPRATGFSDAAPVRTEPFAEWVISGVFSAGRPDWSSAGAQLVPQTTAHEQRKLFLLNGAHSLLAYAGSIRGAQTVSQAMQDPIVAEWVDQWWQVASRYVALPAAELAAYQTSLRERFANPRINHQLAQIAHDGSQKIPVRILPVLLKELEQGRITAAALRPIAAWTAHLQGHGAPVQDAGGAPYLRVLQEPEPISKVLATLAPQLARPQVISTTKTLIEELLPLS